MRRALLTEIDLPDFGDPQSEPVLGHEIYARRHDMLLRRMAEAQLDAVAIYGDREHMANIGWATGHDPRFEEALLLVEEVVGVAAQLAAVHNPDQVRGRSSRRLGRERLSCGRKYLKRMEPFV